MTGRLKWSLPLEVELPDLADHITDLRAQWDAMSERWQESEKGLEINDWLDRLDDVVDSYEQAQQELDAAREPG